MLIAQFSDLHYATNTLTEVDRCFGYAIDRAIEADIEAAVISGDATDHALELHAPAVEALACRLQQLAHQCPVLLLQGTYSHEPPGTLGVFRRLSGKHPIYVADRIQQVALMSDGCWADSDGWCFDRVPENARAVFSCLPAVNKADVAAAVGATAAAEAVGTAIAALLRGWREVNQRARLAGVATVGVSHGTVQGCVTEHGVPMEGLDHEFITTALFDAAASAFMLGHIHKHQLWQNEARWWLTPARSVDSITARKGTRVSSSGPSTQMGRAWSSSRLRRDVWCISTSPPSRIWTLSRQQL
jgi:exonuclease SbcD